MGYELDNLILDCRRSFRKEKALAARERMRRYCIRACIDGDFVARWFGPGPENDSPRRLIYEDPDFGFCIVSHCRKDPGRSPPHDHGSSWAIYAQVEGHTDMTHWRVVESAKNDEPSGARKKVEVASQSRLQPGDAFLYNEGDIHSPSFDGPSKFLRIEGRNLFGRPRNEFEAVDPEDQES
ncbi:hypothetical protein [Thioalkalivibrio sp. HK1]|uniref:hypothetical protein n=1 Tax=Thioalkalivibrio sp. HK1 TaxID=1469245 RepID=UPI000470DFA7|nr:hypothetical protein [Thioalkalivibrio sp. HK1]